MEYSHVDGGCTKISFAFYKAFFLSLSLCPCYMKYYFLQEYGRLLSIYVTLHFWTLFSGNRNIANNFSPYSEISVSVGSANQHYFTYQTGTRLNPYDSISPLIKPLHHCSLLCVIKTAHVP